jgi:hypothetical protein
LPRQIDGEDAAPARQIAHADCAVAVFDALPADRQPKAEPGSIGASLELFKNESRATLRPTSRHLRRNLPCPPSYRESIRQFSRNNNSGPSSRCLGFDRRIIENGCGMSLHSEIHDRYYPDQHLMFLRRT